MSLPQGMTDTFFEAIKARLVALEESPGVPLFKRVFKAPFLDIARFMSNPSHPAAVILDRGSTENPNNGQIVTRRFSIGVIDCVQRDHMGEATMAAVLNRGDIMAAALITGGADEDAYQIMEVLDSSLEAVQHDEGPLLVLCKEYPCTAKLDKAAAAVPAGGLAAFRYQLAGAGLTPPIEAGQSRALGAINTAAQFGLLIDVSGDDVELESVNVTGDASVVSGDTPGTISENTTRTLVLAADEPAGSALVAVEIDGVVYSFTFTWS